ncbi:MAG: hypothetical protein ACK4NY_18000 [Spirosomataceae bacterium]
MNVDLTNTFKDARRLINSWKDRYSKEEYPQKVVMNIFYRKYAIDRMWSKVISNSYANWQIAYEQNMLEYSKTAQNEIIPVLESLIKADKKVSTIKFSDFNSYIRSASRGDSEAIKGIEYTYFLHRIFDELIILWLSFVNSGVSKVDAVTRLTGAIIPRDMPINSYSEIEQILDQLGAENYLQSLFMKEFNNQL